MPENSNPKPEESSSEQSSTEQASPSAAGSGPRATGRPLLGGLLGVLMDRGKRELERAASGTRVRLDLRQLRRDRDAMYQKLGREVRALLEGGEIQHPGLQRGVERIHELDRKIAEVEAEMSLAGIAPEPEESRDRQP